MFLMLVISACNPQKETTNPKQKRNQLLSTFHLKNGDIVFRKGLSLESQAVLMADVNGDYSHVGIVQIIDKMPYVIHIEPDSLETTIDYAKCEKLSTFFNPDYASIGCVMRIKEMYSEKANLAVDTANAFLIKKISFDEAYDLETIDKMYCTEFIWKAFELNGIHLIDVKKNTVFIPLLKNKVILPSSLFYSSYLDKVYYF